MKTTLPDNFKMLWTTLHGSHAWNMEHEKSDLDLTTVYQFDTREILCGHPLPKTWPQLKYRGITGAPVEESYMELGHLIKLLKRGNINAIVATASLPDTAYWTRVGSFSDLLELREIIGFNLSKSMFLSCIGMAQSQLTDSTKRENYEAQKNLKASVRTSRFGQNILNGEGLKFEGVTENVTREDALMEMTALRIAYDHSDLPDIVDPKPFEKFLLKMRMVDLTDDHSPV